MRFRYAQHDVGKGEARLHGEAVFRAVVRGLLPVLDQLRPDVELAIEVTPHRLNALGSTADELLDALHERGFRPYRLPNDYDAASYPKAVRGRGPVPLRCDRRVKGETEIVFSWTDAASLS